MDRMGANFFRTVEMIVSNLAANPLVLTLPIGAEDNFQVRTQDPARAQGARQDRRPFASVVLRCLHGWVQHLQRVSGLRVLGPLAPLQPYALPRILRQATVR